jgi:hypothetical protein
MLTQPWNPRDFMEHKARRALARRRVRASIERIIDRVPVEVRQRAAELAASIFVEFRDLSKLELLPVEALKAAQRQALRYLLHSRGYAPLGDYLEFGVYAGTSLRCMYEVMKEMDLYAPRLFGFDSFEGLPDGAEREDDGRWTPGQFRLGIEVTRAVLRKHGVNLNRVDLKKGWFCDTLTPDLRARRSMRRVSVVMLDCKLHSSTRDALQFCAPLMVDETILFFNDWHTRHLAMKGMGQKRAFEEFLAAHPEFSAERFGSYLDASCFVVRRRQRSGAKTRLSLVKV